jgi:uncharacterized protein YutE (UPF0331/DUF86 family)
MVVTQWARERVILESLRQRYEGDGYAFFAYPPADLVPAFLEDYRPDAIAIGPGGRVAIEVKHDRGGPAAARLSKVASLFSHHPDWQFIVVYSDETGPGHSPVSRPSRIEIEGQLREIEGLADQGYRRAALVLAWAALEAAARALKPTEDGSEEKGVARAPRQILESLEREGLLERELARSLWRIADLRDAIVHGDFGANVDQDTISDVVGAVRQIGAHVPSTPTANG